jgi:hypothetical protein
MHHHGKEGYLYIAARKSKYIEEAIFSACSLRMVDKFAHITLITNISNAKTIKGANVFNKITYKSDIKKLNKKYTRKEGLLYKVKNIYSLSPYQKTFFVDTDTYFIGNCRSLFNLLINHDICMSHSVTDISLIKLDNELLYGYTPYNTGVILFKKCQINYNLFKEWYHLFNTKLDNYVHDQPAFMESLLRYKCKIYILHSVWNARFIRFERFTGKVMILHGRDRNMHSIQDQINITYKNRIWHPILKKCIY